MGFHVLDSNGNIKLVSVSVTTISGGPKSTSLLTTGTGATYTVPAGVTAIIVECIGAGGGGGGAASVGAGGGGGGGSYARKVIATSPGATFLYTVGTGGAGGVAGANAGTAGNSTTFDNGGAIITAQGGTGGGGMAAGTTLAAAGGGVGQGATGGTLNFRGPSRAMSGYRFSSTAAMGGLGGASIFGPGGANNALDGTASSAIAGQGSGGAGAVAITANQAGGAGADGYIVVTEYGT